MKFSPLLIIGVAGVVGCELALLANVQGWDTSYPTRFIRANMTPVAWCFYLLAVLGALTSIDGKSWLRRWRWRFAACWLWSIICWCYFDFVNFCCPHVVLVIQKWNNFYFMRDPRTGLRAWEYHGLPTDFGERLVGYLIAFGAIAPGMFLSAELLMRLGLRRIRSTPIPMPRRVLAGVAILGAALCVVPVVVGGPISNMALWLGTFALLDPINAACGRPSILGDWQAGRWGRTMALGLGGLWCGLLWEFWNYWAVGKWTYHLPFVGPWQKIRYFEMPVPGLLGFIAFGIQTWVMWQTTLLLLAPLVEGERSNATDAAIGEKLCF